MRRFSLILLILTGLLLAGCNEKKADVLATVRGKAITQEAFDKRVATLPEELHPAAEAHKKDFVKDMVAEELMLQEAKSRKLDQLPDVKALLEEANKKILISKLVEMEIAQKAVVGEDEPLKYYEAHKNEFMAPLLLRASHILVKSEDEAKAIKTQLDQGADFEQLAREKSIDTTAQRGGDLGYFQKGQLLPEFEEAALKLKKGEISGIVKTKFGNHIIKLTDRVEPAIREYNSIAQALREKMVLAKRKAALQEYVTKMETNAPVSFNEKLLAPSVRAGESK